MNPWTLPAVAAQQRALVDEELQRDPWPAHFTALAEAVRATHCPGAILEYGCASGYGREVLDRAGVPYRSYEGMDISAPALAIAMERYPESRWVVEQATAPLGGRDIVVDGCSLIHRVDTWRADIAKMAAASRRWLILHRLPVIEGGTADGEPWKEETHGYGQTFPALRFDNGAIVKLLRDLGFERVARVPVDRGPTVTDTYARVRRWATYFDRNYSTRALAMWTSLQKDCPNVILHALCYDEESYALAQRAGMQGQKAEEFLASRKDLALDSLPGPRRTRVEHMWTVGPAWLAALMEHTGEPVTYVDADVFFFSSPEPIFAEMGNATSARIPHGFAYAWQGLPGPTEKHLVFGRYNVGIVPLQDRAEATAWADRCKAWCYDRVEGEKYGDQKYLENLVGIEITHPGACLGPWAAWTRALDVRDGVVYFGNRPLIAYHMSALKLDERGNMIQASRPEYQLTRRIVEMLYAPYLAALKETGATE